MEDEIPKLTQAREQSNKSSFAQLNNVPGNGSLTGRFAEEMTSAAVRWKISSMGGAMYEPGSVGHVSS
jgi:hypothetical protein